MICCTVLIMHATNCSYSRSENIGPRGVGLCDIYFHASLMHNEKNAFYLGYFEPPLSLSLLGSLIITPDQSQYRLFSMQCCGGSMACFLPALETLH